MTEGCAGFALLAVVFILLSLGILGTMLVGLYSPAVKGTAEAVSSLKAAALADAGVRWVVQNQFIGDTNFLDNVSPTDPPFGANSVTLGEGQFWVQYSQYYIATQTSINITVTARVQGIVRVVNCRLTLARATPLRRVIYAVGNVDLRQGRNDPSTPTGITGDITSQGTIQRPATSQLTFTGVEGANALYRYQGIDQTTLDDPASRDRLLDAVTVTFYPAGQDTDGLPPDQNPDGSYGSPNGAGTGYIFWCGPNVSVVWMHGGASGGGQIQINGSLVDGVGGANVLLQTQNDPVVNWTSFAKDITGDGNPDKIPAFVVGSLYVSDSSAFAQPVVPNITVTGAAVVGSVLFWAPARFTLNGVLLSQGNIVTAGSGNTLLTLDDDPVWSDPLASIPWLPTLVYELEEWREEVS